MCICFHPQVKGWEAPTLFGLLERANLNTGFFLTDPTEQVPPTLSHKNGHPKNLKSICFKTESSIFAHILFSRYTTTPQIKVYQYIIYLHDNLCLYLFELLITNNQPSCHRYFYLQLCASALLVHCFIWDSVYCCKWASLAVTWHIHVTQHMYFIW
jgi:hypothetical protein